MSHKQDEIEDPFDVFGSEKDDDENEDKDETGIAPEETATTIVGGTSSMSPALSAHALATTMKMKITTPQQRDPSCGPLVFHNGTELALLQFVERNIMIQESSLLKTSGENENSAVAAKAATTKKKREHVIQLIDEFCYSRHWMMNIGPEKGAILDRFLIESLERHTTNQPFTLVEVGTYCGYSTIRIAHTILQWQQQQQQQKVITAHDEIIMDFHIFTVDVNPQTVSIARQLVSMAGLDAHVTFLMLDDDNDDDDDALSKTIQSAIQEKYKNTTTPTTTNQAATASFVFLDHDKYKYLSDLKQLEASKIIRAQTSVAADNVIFHGLDDYRNHLQQYAKQGVVETRLEMGHLEYVIGDDNDDVFLPGTTTVTSRSLPGNKQRYLQTNADFRDGLELTFYLKDP